MGAPEVSNGCCLAEYPTGRGLIPTPFPEEDADGTVIRQRGAERPGQGVVASAGWVTKDAVPPSAAVVVVSPE